MRCLIFFAENEIYDLAFNMEETEGVNDSSSLNGSEVEKKNIVISSKDFGS